MGKIMFILLRFALLSLLLLTFTTIPQAAESTDKTDKKRKAAKSEHKVRSKKNLLSAFLLTSMLPSQSEAPSLSNTFAFSESVNSRSYYGDGGLALSFLKTTEMKNNAMKDLYSKYGFNKTVQLNLRTFSQHKYSFSERLRRSSRYIGTMADIFLDEGLPVELAYLPLIESQFNPYAYSSKKAAGPWQFMPATAKLLNMKMDWWVDERRDPIKSTKAAAQYLRYLYEKFGSWNLALAAYNAGESRVRRAMKITGKKDYWAIRKTPYLARETKNYVPSYIAATAIAMHPENFGFENINFQRPMKYDEVVIETPMDLEVVARFTGANTIDIKELNPELRRLCTPPNVSSYTLRIPRGTKRRFLKSMARTRGYEPYYLNLYTVKSGDTIEKIAKELGSSMQKIIRLNSLGKKALIMAGKSILVPLERNWEKVFGKSSVPSLVTH